MAFSTCCSHEVGIPAKKRITLYLCSIQSREGPRSEMRSKKMEKDKNKRSTATPKFWRFGYGLHIVVMPSKVLRQHHQNNVKGTWIIVLFNWEWMLLDLLFLHISDWAASFSLELGYCGHPEDIWSWNPFPRHSTLNKFLINLHFHKNLGLEGWVTSHIILHLCSICLLIKAW